jgi:hypothetical protein
MLDENRVAIQIEQHTPITNTKPVLRRKVCQSLHIARQPIRQPLNFRSYASADVWGHFRQLPNDSRRVSDLILFQLSTVFATAMCNIVSTSYQTKFQCGRNSDGRTLVRLTRPSEPRCMQCISDCTVAVEVSADALQTRDQCGLPFYGVQPESRVAVPDPLVCGQISLRRAVPS